MQDTDRTKCAEFAGLVDYAAKLAKKSEQCGSVQIVLANLVYMYIKTVSKSITLSLITQCKCIEKCSYYDLAYFSRFHALHYAFDIS